MDAWMVLKLSPGDEVYWNDPDEGLCSRVLTIDKIWVEDEGQTVTIRDIDGYEVDCFAGELE